MSDRTSEPGPTRPPRHARRRRRLAIGAVLLAALAATGADDRADAAEPAVAVPPAAQPAPSKPDAAPNAAPAEDPSGKSKESTEASAAGNAPPAATAAETRMAEAFAELADADAAVREEARTRLMGLDRRYLPALQKLVERSRPLLPSQAAVLREIVTHVYLAGEPYAADGNSGFLGVRMVNVDVAAVDPPPDAAPDAPAPDVPAPPPGVEVLIPTRKGVVITERMPGFVGYRMLLDGDVIVGLTDQPEFQLDTGEGFSAAVRRVGAGRTVRFDILRRGQLAKVAVTLDPRPEAADANLRGIGQMDELVSGRRQKAEAYWDQTFGPLLKDRVG